MLSQEVTEMNYIRKISRELSPACTPPDTGTFDLHFSICGRAVNVLAEHVNLLSDECIVPNEDKNYGMKNSEQEVGDTWIYLMY